MNFAQTHNLPLTVSTGSGDILIRPSETIAVLEDQDGHAVVYHLHDGRIETTTVEIGAEHVRDALGVE